MNERPVVMKVGMLIVIALTTMLCACIKEETYPIPDDFPKKEFYPYAPYRMEDTVYFSDGDTTVSYSVDQSYWMYEGEVVRKGYIREEARKHVVLSGREGTVGRILLDMECIDREVFRINLDCGPYPYEVYSKYEKFSEECEADSTDAFPIFRAFVDEITLTDKYNSPKALIRKGKGIVWFADINGTIWRAVQE
ncbi:MAG: hypothetical protein K6A36_00890 [Paludibacteraceae bacterium]|nr:hypothetical protein [Paludibacteraceae bacterium]